MYDRAATIEEMHHLVEIRKNRIRDRKFAAVMVQTKIGHTRRLLREADELAEARQILHEMVREQHEETKHIKLIQRYFRGFLARKAARRWAFKASRNERHPCVIRCRNIDRAALVPSTSWP